MEFLEDLFQVGVVGFEQVVDLQVPDLVDSHALPRVDDVVVLEDLGVEEEPHGSSQRVLLVFGDQLHELLLGQADDELDEAPPDHGLLLVELVN